MVDLLEEVDNVFGLDVVFVPIEWIGQLLERLTVVGKFGHLEADHLALFIVDEGTRAEDVGRKGEFEKMVQLWGMLGLRLMIEFNGRIAQAEYHTFTTRLNEL